jgi:hypothetical protein
MGERLTGEDLRVLSLNVASLTMPAPALPEYVSEYVRDNVQGQVASLITELRERRAADLTADEAEALTWLRARVNRMVNDREAYTALTALDKLLRRVP